LAFKTIGLLIIAYTVSTNQDVIG